MTGYPSFPGMNVHLIKWGIWTDQGITAQPKESVQKMKRLMLLWHTEKASDINPRAYWFSSISYPKAVVFLLLHSCEMFSSSIYTGHWIHAKHGEREETPCQNSWISKLLGNHGRMALWLKTYSCKWNVPHSIPKVKYFKLNSNPISPWRKQYSLYPHTTKGAGWKTAQFNYSIRALENVQPRK